MALLGFYEPSEAGLICRFVDRRGSRLPISRTKSLAAAEKFLCDRKGCPAHIAGYRSGAERAAALRRYLSTMFQGSSKATAAAAAAAAVAAGVVVGKALAQEDALLRLRLRLAQFVRGRYTLRDVRIPESLLPIELRGAADAEGLVACDVAIKHGLIDEVAPPKSLRGIDCNGCLVVACFSDSHTHLVKTVSYTHLTLPTKRIV